MIIKKKIIQNRIVCRNIGVFCMRLSEILYHITDPTAILFPVQNHKAQQQTIFQENAHDDDDNDDK